MVVATTVGALIIGIAATIIIPPVYRAQASFVANTSSNSKLQGASGGSTGLGGIISQLGGTMGGDPSESPNFYVELLVSRELRTRLLPPRSPNPPTATPRT